MISFDKLKIQIPLKYISYNPKEYDKIHYIKNGAIENETLKLKTKIIGITYIHIKDNYCNIELSAKAHPKYHLITAKNIKEVFNNIPPHILKINTSNMKSLLSATLLHKLDITTDLNTKDINTTPTDLINAHKFAILKDNYTKVLYKTTVIYRAVAESNKTRITIYEKYKELLLAKNKHIREKIDIETYKDIVRIETNVKTYKDIRNLLEIKHKLTPNLWEVLTAEPKISPLYKQLSEIINITTPKGTPLNTPINQLIILGITYGLKVFNNNADLLLKSIRDKSISRQHIINSGSK